MVLQLKTILSATLICLSVSIFAQRTVTLDDFLNGERVTGVALSHGGNYVLEHFTVTDGPKTQRYSVVKRLPQGTQVARYDSVHVEWMPRTEALLLHRGDSLVRIDPVTDARTVLARNLPKRSYVERVLTQRVGKRPGRGADGLVQRFRRGGKEMNGMRKAFVLLLLCGVLAALLAGCGGGGQKSAKRELKVYNWGDYIDPEILKSFEKETGIHVIYDTFATNEDMYVKVKSGGSDYDVAIPSDYMISRLLRDGLLEKIDFSKVPNYSKIGAKYKNLDFDPKNEYSVPYMWGTVGIAYNKKMVTEPVDSWGILWDAKYAKQIFMLDSPRDSIGITLKYLGYSLNTGNEVELAVAGKKLVEQKPLVLAYLVDEAKDKMIAGEGALAVVWSGDAMFMMEKNKDIAYAIPKEGTNLWFDAMVILKGTKHKAEAEEFINYMTRPDVAKKNVEYIGYASPIPEVESKLPEDVRKNIAAYPDAELLKNAEVFNDLTENMPKYDKVWTEVKVAQ